MPPQSNQKNRNRRRKKRRTEDFSSDSESDSSSSENASVTKDESQIQDPPQYQDELNIDDMDIASEPETSEQPESGLSRETQEKLDSIKFTSTGNQTLAEAKETVRKDRSELDAQFLEYMTSTFSNDLDQLRKKPDFTEKSIVLLAKTLQSGSNMFDSDTLAALLKE